MFTMQKIHCQICAKEFEYDFCSRGGYGPHRPCCSRDCYDEYEYRRILALLGKPYEPMDEKYKQALADRRKDY